MLADKHPNQQERIETLESYHVLDSDAEADFDDIVALASKICDTPVSLISLVDDDRQWFKARLGFEPSETSLEESVCSHAILEEEFLEVPDMAEDVRTSDNPLHTGGPKVKFYAGANLVAPNGQAIGTLCVLDTKPRQLSEFQRQALKTLSRQVMMQLELRRKIQIEAALRSEMDHRVKNSLQTIASILRMANRRISDPEALTVLELVERRLGAVASLHSELMRQDGRAVVEMTAYLTKLVDMISVIAPDTVEIAVSSNEGWLEARKASAVGMIVSEFVANSVKHAFPGGRSGKVTISLKPTASKEWALECRDDGVGDGSETSSSGSGMGQMLMSSAAMQLDGEVEHEVGSEGTSLKVSFEG